MNRIVTELVPCQNQIDSFAVKISGWHCFQPMFTCPLRTSLLGTNAAGDIEVFFKITKSYLNLAKEFQSRSYDALVAHASIVFARYIMLALAQRTGNDPRTLGSLLA